MKTGIHFNIKKNARNLLTHSLIFESLSTKYFSRGPKLGTFLTLENYIKYSKNQFGTIVTNPNYQNYLGI